MPEIAESQPFNIFWSLLPSPEPTWLFSSKSDAKLPLLLSSARLDNVADAILAHPAQKIRVTFTGFQPVWHPELETLVTKLTHGGREINIIIEVDSRILLSSLLALMRAADMHRVSFDLYVNPETDTRTGIYSHIQKLTEHGISFQVFLLNGSKSKKIELFKSLLTLQRSTRFSLGETLSTISEYWSGGRRQAANFVNDGEGFFCLAGIRFMRIDAGGAAYSTPCQCKPSSPSAWEEKTFWGGHFKSCSQAGCPAADVWNLQRFSEPQQARTYFLASQTSDMVSCLGNASLSYSMDQTDYTACNLAPPDPGTPGTIAAFADRLKHKAASHGLAPEEIRTIYHQWREPILAELGEAYATQKLHMACDHSVLIRLGSFPGLSDFLLEDCVQLYQENYPLSLKGSGEIDGLPNDYPEKAAIYCYGKSTIEHIPFFSIIFYNRNNKSLIKKTLDSILEQDFGNFEILAIDDSSRDNSIDTLREYARNDARISLWSSNRYLYEGKIRNALLNYTAGKYICYINSGDVFAHSFFRIAAKALVTTIPDIAIFNRGSSGISALAGRLGAPGGKLSRSRAVTKLLKGELDCSLAGKIFNKTHLQTASRGFAKHDFWSDDDFLLSAILGAKSILTNSFQGWTSTWVGSSVAIHDSFEIPDADLYSFQIHHVQTAGIFLGKGMETSDFLPELAIQNLERAVLPVLLSRKESGRCLFRPDANREMLASEPLFIYGLLGYLGKMKAKLSANTMGK